MGKFLDDVTKKFKKDREEHERRNAGNKHSRIFRDILKEMPIEVSFRTGIDAHYIYLHGGSFFIPASEEGPEYDAIMEANANSYKLSLNVRKLVWDNLHVLKDVDMSVAENWLIENISDVELRMSLMKDVVEWNIDGRYEANYEVTPFYDEKEF